MQNLVGLGLVARYRETWQFFPKKANVKLVTPGVGQILPQGYTLGTISIGPLDKATCKIW